MKIFGANRKSVRLKSRIYLLVIGSLLAIATLLLPRALVRAQSGNVTVTARVTETSFASTPSPISYSTPTPQLSASINNPKDGDSLSNPYITIEGSCAKPGLVVVVIDNGIPIGSTICDSSGLFSLKATLFEGINNLVARQLKNGKKYGPDSAVVRVTYSASLQTSVICKMSNNKQWILGLALLLIGYLLGFWRRKRKALAPKNNQRK